MGSSGGGSSSSTHQAQQQLAMQQQQMAQSERQHRENLALQREALDKPIAAISRDVGLQTEQMVADQQNQRQALRGIRSTYSLFNKPDDNSSGGTTKLGA